MEYAEYKGNWIDGGLRNRLAWEMLILLWWVENSWAVEGGMKNNGTFRRGRNVLVRCRICGKLTHSNLDGCIGLDLCRPCRESAECENEHSDGHHQDAPRADCPLCQAAMAETKQ
jgi:hypothetical protein